MAEQHLTRELLWSIHSGAETPRAMYTVIMSHLFTLCPRCYEEFEGFREELAVAGEPEPFDDLSAEIAALALEQPPRLDEAEREAGARLADLLAMAPVLRMGRVEADSLRYRGVALAELLVEKARGCLPDDCPKSGEMARLAMAVLRNTPPTPVAATAYVRALAYQANAVRAADDLALAHDLFAHARLLMLFQGIRTQRLQGEVDWLEAILRRAQRRLDDSQHLLLRSILVFRSQGMSLDAARAIMTLSLVRREQGDLQHAILLTREAIELIGPADKNPRLAMTAWHNLGLFLCDAGEFIDAADTVLGGADMYGHFQDPWTQNRKLWLEGRIAAGLGKPEVAEFTLVTARDGFLREGAGYDAALVSLDLAGFYLEQGQIEKLKSVAQEIIPAFEALEIHREALAAVLLLLEAARREQVTVELLSEMARYFERARRNPGLPYRQGE